MRPKFRFFNSCYKFLLGIIFGGYAFDLEKATKIQLLLQKKENDFFEKPRGVLQKC